MARPKGAKNKSKKTDLDPNVEEIVEVEVEFMCPKRGKVKQKVKMKRLKPVRVDDRAPQILAKDTVDEIDEDDGLSIYDGTDELEE